MVSQVRPSLVHSAAEVRCVQGSAVVDVGLSVLLALGECPVVLSRADLARCAAPRLV